MKTLKILFSAIFFLGAFQAQASLALRGKDFSPAASHKTEVSHPQELSLDRDFIKDGRKGFTKNDVAQIVPMNLAATNDGDYVKEQILKKTASSILKSPIIQNSFLAKTMKKAQKATKVEMAIKSSQAKVAKKSDKKPSVADTVIVAKPTEHKFDFNLEALKKEAKLTYKGFVQSNVKYNHTDEALNISLEETLSNNSKIALSHQADRTGSTQMVNFEVQW